MAAEPTKRVRGDARVGACAPAPARLAPVLVAWVTAALAVYVATWLVPGVHVEGPLGAFVAAALIALLNALLPPLIAALRLPFMLVARASCSCCFSTPGSSSSPSDLSDNAFKVDSFWAALAAALVVAAVTVVLEVLLGTNDDDTYTLRVIQRIARRSGERVVTDVPGILYLEIDGLALPVLRSAPCATATPPRWRAGWPRARTAWRSGRPTSRRRPAPPRRASCSARTTTSPPSAGSRRRSGTLMTCSAPPDCAEIERRHATGHGLLADGGASRSNLLSGEADHVILTISRMEAEKKANPGYRAFFANGFNVTRTLVLFFYEVGLEWIAAVRGIRRDVRPRGHRGGKYPFLRAALAVVVRDLTVYSVLSDMMKGRPAVYACFAGYDEVAHHSGLERADTLEVLRKLDQQFGRIARARQYAARPYEIVVLSDHGQTQGATFKQRNGYGLDDLVRRSLEGRDGQRGSRGGDENDSAVAHAFRRRPARKEGKRAKNDVSGEETVVLGSGNLGLVYLMEEKRRLTLEEIDERHPRLIPALREHPHVGWLLVRSAEHGPVALGARGARYLAGRPRRGRGPAGGRSPPTPPRHLRRTDGFAHVADIMVNSFYDHAARRGLRLRGADLVPRRHGRSADAGHPAVSGAAAAAAGADRRRRGGARRAGRVAPPAARGVLGAGRACVSRRDASTAAPARWAAAAAAGSRVLLAARRRGHDVHRRGARRGTSGCATRRTPRYCTASSSACSNRGPIGTASGSSVSPPTATAPTGTARRSSRCIPLLVRGVAVADGPQLRGRRPRRVAGLLRGRDGRCSSSWRTRSSAPAWPSGAWSSSRCFRRRSSSRPCTASRSSCCSRS